MTYFKKKEWIFIVSILMGAFLLISYAARIPFNGSDEIEHIELSKTISFNPSNINLPMGNSVTEHPMLATYCVKIGTLLFNAHHPFAVRFIFILFGVSGLLFTFLLTRSGFGVAQAVLATILLSLSQFYIGYMRYATEDSLLLVFGIWALLIFYQALQKESGGRMVFLGVILGFGFLAKESMLFFVMIFALYLAFSPKYRHWLKRKQFYFSLLVMGVVVAPSIIWNINNRFISAQFGTGEAGFGLSPVIPMLYFGEIISQFVDKSVIRGAIDCEYPFMYWVMGVLALGAVIYSCFKKNKNDLTKLLLTVIFFNAVLFLFIKNRHPERFLNNHDWPSLTVIPAIILTAKTLVDFMKQWKFSRYVILILLFYLIMNVWNFVNIPEPFFVPRADLQSEENLWAADRYVNSGEINKAIDRYKRVTKLAPFSKVAVKAWEKLGLIYFGLGETQMARDYWEKGLGIDPTNDEIHKHLEFSRMAYADKELRVYFKFNSVDEPTVVNRPGVKPPFEMWFEASHTPGISYAQSDDGIHWIRNAPLAQVVLSGTSKGGDWNQFVETPEVVFHQGRYLMVFVGYNYDINKDGNRDISDEGADGIGFSSSFEATTGWSLPVRIILRASVKEAWDYGHVGDPSSLVFDPVEERYHLWYTGSNIFNGQRKWEERPYYFGHAVTDKSAKADDPDHWHKTNPNQSEGYVFAPSETKSAFDSGEIFDPNVLWNDNGTKESLEDDFFEMWYTAYSKDNGKSSIGYTRSHTRIEAEENNVPFGSVWDNPRYVAYRGDKKSNFDDSDLYEPNVLRDGHNLRLFYVGSEVGNIGKTSIGMAMSSPENQPVFIEIEDNPLRIESHSGNRRSLFSE